MHFPRFRPRRRGTPVLVLTALVVAAVVAFLAARQNPYVRYCYRLMFSDEWGNGTGGDAVRLSSTAYILSHSKGRQRLYPKGVSSDHPGKDLTAFAAAQDSRYGVAPRFGPYLSPPAPAAWLSLFVYGKGPQFTQFWVGLVRILVGLFPLGLFLLAPREKGSFGHRDQPRRDLLDLIALTAMAWLFFPLVSVNYLGSLTVTTGWLLIGFFAALRRDARVWAGCFLAAAILSSPIFLLLLVWLLFRRDRRTLLSVLVSGVLLFVVTLFRAGWRDYGRYFRIVVPYLEAAPGFHANRSLPGVLRRLATGADPSVLDLSRGPQWVVWVGAAAGLVLVGIALALLWRRERNSKVARPDPTHAGAVGEAYLFLIPALIAAPTTWEHHCLILLPLFAALWFGQRRREMRFPLWAVLAVIASYVLLAPEAWPKQWGGGETNVYTLGLPLVGLAVLWVVLAIGVVRSASWFAPAEERSVETAGTTSGFPSSPFAPAADRYFLRIPSFGAFGPFHAAVGAVLLIILVGYAREIGHAYGFRFGLSTRSATWLELFLICYIPFSFFLLKKRGGAARVVDSHTGEGLRNRTRRLTLSVAEWVFWIAAVVLALVYLTSVLHASEEKIIFYRLEDMFPLIQRVVREQLTGHDPYVPKFSLGQWGHPCTYWPGVWMPYLAAEVARLDYRIVSAFLTVAVGWFLALAGAAEARRMNNQDAVLGMYLITVALLAALWFLGPLLRATTFVQMAPLWFWMAVLGWGIATKRPAATALATGFIAATRFPFIALVPLAAVAVFRMPRRRRFGFYALLCLLPPLVLVGPYIVADPAAFYQSSIHYYSYLSSLVHGTTGRDLMGLHCLLPHFPYDVWVATGMVFLAAMIPVSILWARRTWHHLFLLWASAMGFAALSPAVFFYVYIPALILLLFAVVRFWGEWVQPREGEAAKEKAKEGVGAAAPPEGSVTMDKIGGSASSRRASRFTPDRVALAAVILGSLIVLLQFPWKDELGGRSRILKAGNTLQVGWETIEPHTLQLRGMPEGVLGLRAAWPRDGRLEVILGWQPKAAVSPVAGAPSELQPDLEVDLNQWQVTKVPLGKPGNFTLVIPVDHRLLYRGVNVLAFRPSHDSPEYPDSLRKLGTLSYHDARWIPAGEE